MKYYQLFHNIEVLVPSVGRIEGMDFAALKIDFYIARPPLAAFTLVPPPIGPDQDIERAGSRFGEQVLRFLFILDIYLFILELILLWGFFFCFLFIFLLYSSCTVCGRSKGQRYM